jgi:hypothetical protein
MKEKFYLVTFTQARKGIITVPARDPEEALTNAEEMLGDMDDQDYQEFAGDGEFEYAVLTELREEVDPNQLRMWEEEVDVPAENLSGSNRSPCSDCQKERHDHQADGKSLPSIDDRLG